MKQLQPMLRPAGNYQHIAYLAINLSLCEVEMSPYRTKKELEAGHGYLKYPNCQNCAKHLRSRT